MFFSIHFQQDTMIYKNSDFWSTSGQVRKDLKSFNEKIKLKALLRNKTIKIKKLSKQTVDHISKLKTIGKPIETFIKTLNKDVIEWFSNKHKLPKSNSTDTVKNVT